MAIISGSSGSSGTPPFGLLFDSTLSSANATIDTGASGIAGTASHLLIYFYLRSNKNATTDTVTVTVNNDSSAVYYQQVTQSFNTTVQGVPAQGGTSFNLDSVPAATAPAGVFTPWAFFLPQYAGTVGGKALQALAGYRASSIAGGLEAKDMIMFYDSTSAISRLAVTCSGQFIVGSRMTIYGLI